MFPVIRNRIIGAYTQIPKIGCFSAFTPGYANATLQNVRFNTTHTDLLHKSLGKDVFDVEPTVKIQEIDKVYAAPKQLKGSHDITVCELKFMAYSTHRLNFYVDFARKAAFALRMPCSGIIPLPTQIKRWNTLKSPFVHKSSMEIFERRTHRRMLVIKDSNPQVVKFWLDYIQENAPGGVGMQSKVFEYESLGCGKTIIITEAEQQELDRLAASLPPTQDKVVAMANKVAEAMAKDPRASIEAVTKQVVDEMHKGATGTKNNRKARRARKAIEAQKAREAAELVAAEEAIKAQKTREAAEAKAAKKALKAQKTRKVNGAKEPTEAAETVETIGTPENKD